jgi:hypothetical protein
MALIQTEFRQINLVATDIDDDHVLAEQQDSGSFLYEQVSGNILKKVIIDTNKDPRLLQNVGLSVVSNTPTNGLTIALKQNDAATDPTTTHKNKSVIAFRSSTLGSSAVAIREITAALSMTVSSGSTLGSVSGSAVNVFVYAIDNAGTVKLGIVSGRTLDESILHTTTAEGGAGAADSRGVFYSDAVYSNVAVRLIGMFTATEATAGTWVTNPSAVVSGPVDESNFINVWTPSVTSQAGTFTSVSAVGSFVTTGNKCLCRITITITTNGTAATNIIVTLPFNSLIDSNAVGNARAGGNGIIISGLVTAGSANMTAIRDYLGAYPGADGRTLQLTFEYIMEGI